MSRDPLTARLLGLLSEPALMVTPDGGVLAWNAAARVMLGRGDAVPASVHELAADAGTVAPLLVRMSGATSALGSLTLRHEDGTALRFKVEGGVAALGTDGRPQQLLLRLRPSADERSPLPVLRRQIETLNREIRRRHAVEADLRASEERFRHLAETLPQLVWTASADGRIDYRNRRWHAFTGLDDGASGKQWINLLHPQDRKAALARWRHAVESGSALETELRLRGADGTYHWFLARAVPTGGPAGAAGRWLGSLTDISEIAAARETLARGREELELLVRKRTEQLAASNRFLEREVEQRRRTQEALEARERELRASEARYRAFFENSDEALFLLDALPDGRIEVGATNPAHARITGLPADMAAGRDPRDLWPSPAAEELVAQVRACVAAGRPLRFEQVMELPGGRRELETILVPVPEQGMQGTRILGSARDVTEQRRAEATLRQAQKMEAVGQLTGGVAHDFNNLLQVIWSSLELLDRELAEGSTGRRQLASARDAVERGKRLNGQLLAFARRQPLAPVGVALKKVLDDIVELLRRTLGERIRIETALAEDLWPVLVDRTQLENALLNLAVNARDAMGGEGLLRITAANRTVGAAGGELEPGSYVELAVEDSGCGMPPEVLARVFEPFFTTKAEGQGTGLGLSMVYGFVKQSKGQVTIDSSPGRGTTVRLALPRGSTLAEPAAPFLADATGGRERILLVEDNEAVREAVAELLRMLGYELEQAAGGEQALAILEAGLEVDLLFTDVMMPGALDGGELARRARLLRPGLAVLFSSGHAGASLLRDGRLEPGVTLLNKPYGAAELDLKIREALAASAGRAGAARPRLLVVEDDVLILLDLVQSLEAAGFEVEEAASAAQAREVLERVPVAALVTDLRLPDGCGEELAAAARRRIPALPVVFATGGDTVELLRRQAGTPVRVLAKPYRNEELLRSLAELGVG
ncbi:hybrid sensor histidine kinase/response regulator [Marinimicrococcus flavescens]|uniref:histidine kinase n=1 Tax=Marinimicrococcus flavescens TaxID=3031815 RepID=A0AAP3XR36_9PROT|nr:PAS domain S-box protein [Marinimicrococcus flavescens]